MKAENKLQDIVKRSFSKFKTGFKNTVYTTVVLAATLPIFQQKKQTLHAAETGYDWNVKLELPTKIMPDNINKYFPELWVGIRGESKPLNSFDSDKTYSISPLFMIEYDKSIQKKNHIFDWGVGFSGIAPIGEKRGALTPSYQLGFTKKIDLKKSSIALGFSHLLYLNNILNVSHLGEVELALGGMWLKPVKDRSIRLGGTVELHAEPDSVRASMYDIRPTIQQANIFAGLVSHSKLLNMGLKYTYTRAGDTSTVNLDKNIKDKILSFGINVKTPRGFKSHQGIGAYAGLRTPFLTDNLNTTIHFDYNSWDKKSTFKFTTEFGIPIFNKKEKKISKIDVQIQGRANNKENKTTPLTPIACTKEDYNKYKEFIATHPKIEDFYALAGEITDMNELGKASTVILKMLYSDLGVHKFIQHVGKEEFEEKFEKEGWEEYSDSVWNVLTEKKDHEIAFDKNSPYNTNTIDKTYSFIYLFYLDKNDIYNKDLPIYKLGCGGISEFQTTFAEHTKIKRLESRIISVGIEDGALHTIPIFLKDGITYFPWRYKGTKVQLIRTTNEEEMFKALEELTGGQMLYYKEYDDGGKFIHTIRNPKAQQLLVKNGQKTGTLVKNTLESISYPIPKEE